ncbi:putative hscarg dehydrogenase [Xylariaceae sp. FL0662B]|nr:putative hscarg dehydrogenase [Xylariaceae sp. FL0662B]
MAKRIIVVVGAAGNQGSSVANTFLNLPHWHVRALTRNPSSDASKSLATRGAEVIRGDLGEPTSLAKAFENASTIFLNTDFWETYRTATAELEAEGKPSEAASLAAFTRETTNGKNAVVAAAAVPTLERLVYSALSSVSMESKGKYTRSMHTEAKAKIVEYIETEQAALAKKTSVIYPGAYVDNPFLTPRFDPDSGKYVFQMALNEDFVMPTINPRESIGPFVRALVEDEDPGVKLLAYDSCLSMGELANRWSKASGKEAAYVPITTKELHEKMGVPYELLDRLDACNEFGYTRINGIIGPHQLKSKVHTKSLDDWLKEKNWEKEFLDSSC